MVEAENTRFFRKTLRHFAMLRDQAPAPSGAPLAFPADWFDLPPAVLADYGAMTFLAGLSTYHRGQPLARAMHYFEPPLRLGQYKIFRSNGYPRAFVTWAGLSAAAERSFAVDHHPLEAVDWTSGGSVWLVDFAAPFGHLDQIVPLLTQNPDVRRVRTLWHNKSGERYRIVEWSRAVGAAKVAVKSYGVQQFRKVLDQEEG
jgi:hemolysin-activating ACP:hemolysin acyltransferase